MPRNRLLSRYSLMMWIAAMVIAVAADTLLEAALYTMSIVMVVAYVDGVFYCLQDSWHS